jgi:cellulose synthase/poly-beta-1,6-N-acetylglucosamine synthase-like glycosyltransferase
VTHHNLWVIDKENGGKVDALNAGINYCRTPLFCAVDADSLLERDSLRQLVTPFLSDSRTIAAGGNVRIVNDCEVRGGNVRKVALPKKLIAQFQVLEYMRAFVAARAGWAALDMLMIISGAFGLFRRDIVAKVGGFDPDAIGEDMELIFRLHRHFRDSDEEYKIAYVPDAVAWTECPETYEILGKQRDRWHRGLTQLLFIHKKMALNPEYGRLGLFGYPYFFLVEFLGPVFELLGYVVVGFTVAMGWLNPVFAALLLAFALLFGFAYSLAAIALEELTFRRYTRKRDVIRLIWLSVLENFGYRQMTVYWRIRGIWKYLAGDMSWGDMTRTGYQTAE